jgi:DNA-binding CsgD family transcriptional regulator
MIDRLQQLYEDSRALGSAGCRVAGEMTWAVRSIPGSDHLVEYEESINSLVETNPLAVLCQYDTEQFDGATLYDVLSVHPLMVVRGQIMRNSAYVASEKQKTSHDARRGSEKFQESVLARLYLVQLIITGLPDELRIAEFTREALAAILGVDDVHLCLTTGTIPPDERWEPIRQRCERAASNPNSFDVSAVEAETGCSVFLLRTTSRLFGLILIDVADAESFSPYEAVLANIANAVAMALEVKRDNAELRTWPERVANLERRLWRIGREFEGAEVIPGVTGVADPYALPEVAQLSPRQWEVLTRLLQGDRVPRIAEELLVSQSTVRNHLGDMFKKLGVHSQEELLDLFRFAKTE